MTQHHLQAVFGKISNEMLFEEVARRLCSLYREEHGVDFLYGTFRLLFHEGRFQGIEECPRNRRYSCAKTAKK